MEVKVIQMHNHSSNSWISGFIKATNASRL